jgi:hypothetical protein
MAEQNTFKVSYNQKYEVKHGLPWSIYVSIIKAFHLNR